jgi:hypothetical protein
MPRSRLYPDAAAKQRAYRARLASEREVHALPPVRGLQALPGTRRWRTLLEHAQLALETVLEERQSYRDARSVAWQHGKRAFELGEDIKVLEHALAEIGPI